MKKIIFNILSVIVFILMIIVLFLNIKTHTTSQFAISLDGKITILSTAAAVSAGYLLGIISALTYSVSLGEKYKEMINFYSRKNEKLSRQSEADTDDKEALQRKIATLEIALKNALDKNQ